MGSFSNFDNITGNKEIELSLYVVTLLGNFIYKTPHNSE